MWKQRKNYSVYVICCRYYSMSYNVTYTTYGHRFGGGHEKFVLYITKNMVERMMAGIRSISAKSTPNGLKPKEKVCQR
jgi:hypothetical protein